MDQAEFKKRMADIIRKQLDNKITTTRANELRNKLYKEINEVRNDLDKEIEKGVKHEV